MNISGITYVALQGSGAEALLMAARLEHLDKQGVEVWNTGPRGSKGWYWAKREALKAVKTVEDAQRVEVNGPFCVEADAITDAAQKTGGR